MQLRMATTQHRDAEVLAACRHIWPYNTYKQQRRHNRSEVCLWCSQEAGETREAFAALKAQFISHHDMLQVKEHELVRQDGKVLPCSIWLSPPSSPCSGSSYTSDGASCNTSA